MDRIMIGSRQIAYVQYDDQSSEMIVQYHTGQTRLFTDVSKSDYQMIAASTNRYDSLVKLTSLRLAENRSQL